MKWYGSYNYLKTHTITNKKAKFKQLQKNTSFLLKNNISFYFYASKFPALLKKNDVFIGPNGQTQIIVESQNRFNLVSMVDNNSSNTNDLNLISIYNSKDGVYFTDDNGCVMNKGKIVLFTFNF